MGQAFEALSAWQVMLAGLLFFGGIYLAFGAATWLLTRHVLPALGLGRPLDPRPRPEIGFDPRKGIKPARQRQRQHRGDADPRIFVARVGVRLHQRRRGG